MPTAQPTDHQDLDTVLAELRACRAERQLLVRSVSHDFRAPLRAITTFGDLLRSENLEDVSDDFGESVGHIVSAAARLDAMIIGWLELARLDGGEPVARVDLSDVVRNARQAIEPDLASRGGRMVVSALPEVRGRESLLRKMFDHLLDNALKFSPTTLHIVVDHHREGATHVVTVADQGIGFDPVHADRIFELFERLHTEDEFPGLGVGLAVAQKVARIHGGSISATGEPTTGARFEIRLPDT